jgi:cell fate regulator YaaT (PSP1 superfamily)
VKKPGGSAIVWAMPIIPLPQFEADLEADRKAYEALKAPTSMVVRFGVMRLIGEYPYDGSAKPGCGSKIVVRTHRGTELAEMLTSTCPNGGCGHAVTRKQMLAYVENSGGRDYPFFTEGKVLRIATVEDLNQQAALDAQKPEMVRKAREIVSRVGLQEKMKMVEVEPLLGGERLTFYFYGEERVDFRPVVMELAAIYHNRIELRQIGARDEARLAADYEKCGQHCCCRQFLKVLKPVSMKQAKIQKATLDPLKISGRCGRLMCCLRYEENTYDELKKNLPKKKVPVMTPDGPGIVIDTQILTQLVLVRMDATGEDAAYPVESLTKVEMPGRGGKPGGGGGGAGGGGEDDDGADDVGGAEGSMGPGGPGGPSGGGGSGGGGGGGGGSPMGGGGGQGPRRDGRGPGGPGGPGGGGRGGRDGRGPGGPGGGGGGGRGPGGPGGGGPGGGQGPRREDVNERDRRRASKLVPPSEFRQPPAPGGDGGGSGGGGSGGGGGSVG